LKLAAKIVQAERSINELARLYFRGAAYFRLAKIKLFCVACQSLFVVKLKQVENEK
jgi:hypothetical protein